MIPHSAWASACSVDGRPRDGAGVAEITDLLDLGSWPSGMRVIVRQERPRPGTQPHLEDVDGYRLTAFATSTGIGQPADLEARHRLRARCSGRIRRTRSTGLGALPFQPSKALPPTACGA